MIKSFEENHVVFTPIMDKGNSVISISFVGKNFLSDVFDNVIQQKDVRQAKGIFLCFWELPDQISRIQCVRDNDKGWRNTLSL